MIPLRSDALIYAMLWELILVPLPSVPVETPGSTCFPGHWRSNFFGHSEIIGPRKTCRPRSLLSRWLFIEGVLIYIPAYHGIGMGQSRGYIQRISGWSAWQVAPAKMCSATWRWKLTTSRSWRPVVTSWCFSGYGDCYSWFIPGHWMLIFLSVLLFAESPVEKQQAFAVFLQKPFFNMKTWAFFGLGSGASFVMLTDPNLVRGGTSRCAAFVPCAQALAGQVRQTFQTKGQHGLRQILIKL